MAIGDSSTGTMRGHTSKYGQSQRKMSLVVKTFFNAKSKTQVLQKCFNCGIVLEENNTAAAVSEASNVQSVTSLNRRGSIKHESVEATRSRFSSA